MTNEQDDKLPAAALDCGISNTDVVLMQAGELQSWKQPYGGDPTMHGVRDLVWQAGVELSARAFLAVTGGRHRRLPANIDGVPVVGVGELEAIARGGQA